MLNNYYQLAKPGIVYGNLITTAAGFFLAARGHFSFKALFAVLVGIGLVMASACVFNNLIDRGVDSRMARTKKRALVTGAVSVRGASAFASVLGILGFLILALLTNWATTIVTAVGFLVYIVLYGLAKRGSEYGVLVGSIAGAVPPLGGYLAVRGHFDAGAIILFLALALWQMPHFYSIAIYRRKEYEAAGIPVLSVKRGITSTKVQIVVYIVAFTVAAILLTPFGYAGYLYFLALAALGLSWLWRALQGFGLSDNDRWARGLFRYSLIVLMGFSLAITVGPLLP